MTRVSRNLLLVVVQPHLPGNALPFWSESATPLLASKVPVGTGCWRPGKAAANYKRGFWEKKRFRSCFCSLSCDVLRLAALEQHSRFPEECGIRVQCSRSLLLGETCTANEYVFSPSLVILRLLYINDLIEGGCGAVGKDCRPGRRLQV